MIHWGYVVRRCWPPSGMTSDLRHPQLAYCLTIRPPELRSVILGASLCMAGTCNSLTLEIAVGTTAAVNFEAGCSCCSKAVPVTQPATEKSVTSGSSLSDAVRTTALPCCLPVAKGLSWRRRRPQRQDLRLVERRARLPYP